MEPRVHHLPESIGTVPATVLLPGDPERVDLILARLDRAELVGQRREFRVGRGELGGVPIMVVSTGIGGPSTAIAAHELFSLGASTLIRIGTSGALSPRVHVGDIVIASGAIRDEGTSLQYLPLEFPAIASPEVVQGLTQSFSRLADAPQVHIGLVHSKDAFYAQKHPEDLPMTERTRHRYRVWTAGGALASEMECAALFIVGQALGFQTGAVLQVRSSPYEPHAERPTPDGYLDVLQNALRNYVQASRRV